MGYNDYNYRQGNCYIATAVYIIIVVIFPVLYWTLIHSLKDYLIASVIMGVCSGIILSIIIFTIYDLYFLIRIQKKGIFTSAIIKRKYREMVTSQREDMDGNTMTDISYIYHIKYEYIIDQTKSMTKELVFRCMEMEEIKLPSQIIELVLLFVGYDDLKFMYGPYKAWRKVDHEVYDECPEPESDGGIEIKYDPKYPFNHYIKMDAVYLLVADWWYIVLSVAAVIIILWLYIEFGINYMDGFNASKWLVTISLIMCFVVVFGFCTSCWCYCKKTAWKVDIDTDLTVTSVYYEGISPV